MCNDVFEGSAFYFVDYADTARPQPFKSPKVVRTLTIGTQALTPDEDANPQYLGAGMHLVAHFEPRFRIKVKDKDTLQMRFELQDAEGTVVYDDKVKIGIKPCAYHAVPERGGHAAASRRVQSFIARMRSTRRSHRILARPITGAEPICRRAAHCCS